MVNTSDIKEIEDRAALVELKTNTLEALDNLKIREIDEPFRKANKKLKIQLTIRMRAIDLQLSKVNQIEKDKNHQRHFVEMFYEIAKKELSSEKFYEIYRIAIARINAEVRPDE